MVSSSIDNLAPITDCTQNRISELWNSVFYESSSDVSFFITAKGNICSFWAVKSSGPDYYLLAGNFFKNSSVNYSEVYGLVSKLNDSYSQELLDYHKKKYATQQNDENIEGTSLNEVYGYGYLAYAFLPIALYKTNVIGDNTSAPPIQPRDIQSIEEAKSEYAKELKINIPSFKNYEGQFIYGGSSFPGGKVATFNFTNARFFKNLSYQDFYYVNSWIKNLPASQCVENWTCTEWSNCTINKYRTRSCIDNNKCNASFDRPQDLEVNCVPENQTIVTGLENHTINSVQERNESKKDVKNVENIHQIVSPSQDLIDNHTILKIKDKEVLVEKDLIKVDGLNIGIELNMTERLGKIYINTSKGEYELNLLPSEAITKSNKIDKIESINISEMNGRPVYILKGKRTARLFYIFPISAEVSQSIDIVNGSVVSTKRPWWHFLAIGV